MRYASGVRTDANNASSTRRRSSEDDGETFDVGVDTGAPVGPYPHQFPFVGSIVGVTIERLGERPDDVVRAMREGQVRASIASQ